MEHFLCSQTPQQHNAVFFIFSLIAVIWSAYEFYGESFLPNELFKYVKNNVFFSREQIALQKMSLNTVPPRPIKTALPATLVQALTVPHDSAVLCLAVTPLLWK